MEQLVLDIPAGGKFLEKIEEDLSAALDLDNFKIISFSADISKVRLVLEERERPNEPR